MGKVQKQVSTKNQGISSVFKALPIPMISDIPSLRLVRQQLQRLAHDVVPQLRSRQGKITALAIAFIVPTEIRKQLQQALLLPRATNEPQQGGIIAEHTMVHVA